MSIEYDRPDRSAIAGGGERAGGSVAPGKASRTERLAGGGAGSPAAVQLTPATGAGAASTPPPSDDPFGMHLIGTPAGGGASPLAAAAAEVSEYAGFALVSFGRSKSPDGQVLTLNQKLGDLGDALHQHAGGRSPAEEKALRKALRDADAVADKLSSLHIAPAPQERELRQRIAMIERLAGGEESDARGAVDLTPGELREQAAMSLTQLEDVRDRVYTLLAVNTSALDGTIAKTSGWIDTLSAPGVSAADARRLSRAVLDQQAILVELGVELEEVLTTPGPGMNEAAAAYVLAMAKSSERRTVADRFIEQARIAKRRRPLLRAEAMLEVDDTTTRQINELDPEVGRNARKEHAAIDARHRVLDKRNTSGRHVGEHELRKLEVDTREQGLRHQTQLLEVQSKQLAGALGQLGDLTANAFDLELANLRTDLLSLAVEFSILREQYGRKVEAANDAHGGDLDAQWDLLHARERALDELERDLQRFLGKSEFLATLDAAQKKAEDAQVRAFAFQLLTTIALTLAGSAAAQLAKGAAEGAWLARASRAGAIEGDAAAMAAHAARAEAFGAGVGFAVDVAANTGGQVLQGDNTSLLTLITLNTLSPLLIGRVQTQFPAITSANASASRFKRYTVGTLAFTHDKLVLSIEMIAGAALDHATKTLLGARAQSPTDQDAEQWLYQGAAMALGRHLSVRSKLIASRLEKLRASTRSATFDALVAKNQELGSATDDLSLRGDPETARQLLDEYERILAGVVHEDVPSSDGDDDGTHKTSSIEAPGRRRDDADDEPEPIGSPGRRRRKDPPGDDGGEGNRGEPYADWREDANEFGPKQYLPKRQLARFGSLKRRQTWAEIAGAGADDLSSAVGDLIRDADTGHAVLARLAKGDVTALSEVGIHDYPRDYDTTGREWALVEVREGFALFAGKYDAVKLPVDVRVLGHTHPSRTPAVPYNGPVKPDLHVNDAANGDPFPDILANPDNARRSGITPSPADIHAISDGTPHVLYTRYVNSGGGRVLPPQPRDSRPRIEVHLARTRVLRWNERTHEYWYETTMTVKDGSGAPIWAGPIYMRWSTALRDGVVHFTRQPVLDAPLPPGWREP